MAKIFNGENAQLIITWKHGNQKKWIQAHVFYNHKSSVLSIMLVFCWFAASMTMFQCKST